VMWLGQRARTAVANGRWRNRHLKWWLKPQSPTVTSICCRPLTVTLRYRNRPMKGSL
jgi:hypothetical protein